MAARSFPNSEREGHDPLNPKNRSPAFSSATWKVCFSVLESALQFMSWFYSNIVFDGHHLSHSSMESRCICTDNILRYVVRLRLGRRLQSAPLYVKKVFLTSLGRYIQNTPTVQLKSQDLPVHIPSSRHRPSFGDPGCNRLDKRSPSV